MPDERIKSDKTPHLLDYGTEELDGMTIRACSFAQAQAGQGKGTEGVKDDGGKAMWHLLPWKAINGLVRVLTFGASKYSPNGWRSVPNGRDRYVAALLRHLYAIQMGEKVDKESGLRHIDHLLCNAAFLAELED